jgi:hypothetical protein
MLLISAGFDAHRAGSPANLRLEEADYARRRTSFWFWLQGIAGAWLCPRWKAATTWIRSPPAPPPMSDG